MTKTLEKIDLSSNDFTFKSMAILQEFIQDPCTWPKLQTLVLSKNNLKDEGIKDLANAVLKRAQSLNDDGDS